MSFGKKKKKDDPSDFSLIDSLNTSLEAETTGDLDIIEFVDQILTSFDVPEGLFLQQRIIFKAIYGLPLDDTVVDKRMGMTEKELMDQWVKEKKTNWIPNEEALRRYNESAAKENLPLRDSFDYQAIVLQCGMRSGKSATVGMILVYEFFRLIQMENPQRYLGVPTSSTIWMTALASTERQTKGTIFSYVKSYIEGSNFFKKLIDEKEVIVNDLEIEYPRKQIKIAAGHSRADSIVGRTAICVAFDELAMFSNDDGKTSNAGDVYNRVGRATATFGFKSKRVALSSVKEEGDFMQELVNTRWDKQHKGTLIFDLSTFDFNPTMSMAVPVISEDYDRDFVAAQRDYENIRPGALSGFLIPALVEACVYEAPPLIHTQLVQRHRGADPTKPLTEEDIADETRADIRIYSELDAGLCEKAPDFMESVAHADPGVMRDSFGFAVGHGEMTEKGMMTVIDLVLEWMPQQLGRGKVAPVSFINVEDIILDVCRARNVSRLTFDHWNAEGSIQRLHREGLNTGKLTFSAGLQFMMYTFLRERINAGLVKIPNHPTLIEELKNLILVNGKRVDHPKSKDSAIQGRGKISKDQADCIAVVNWIIGGQDRHHERGFGMGGPEGGPTLPTSGSYGIRTTGFSRTQTSIPWGYR